MKKIVWSAIILGLLVSIGGFFGLTWYVRQLFSAVDPSDQTEIHYFVARGSNLGTVAEDLEAKGIAKSADGLRLYARIFQVGDGVQAGDHVLHRSDDTSELIASLEKPPSQVTITILPGWRREEIAEYLETVGLSEFDADDFLEQTKALEGQLMPETYKVAPLSTTQAIVNLLHQQYLDDVHDNPEFQQKLAANGRTERQIITLASLLQREGKTLEEMKIIAGILESRLDDGFPLQLCATAQYATGRNPQTGKWWDPPTLADTQYDSPYNTYVYAGLPPGPISSVSWNAIQAALEPEESDYYYYLHDDQGQIHYAKTLEEHDRNKDLYL